MDQNLKLYVWEDVLPYRIVTEPTAFIIYGGS